jgi:hypothetical protein
MRPRFSLWSDRGAPAQRRWKSPSKRGGSTGPKILLAAIVLIAGFIGIGGILPQLIDPRWTPDAAPGLPVMSLSAPDARTKALDAVGTTASPSRRVITTGEGTLLPPRSVPARDAPERATAELRRLLRWVPLSFRNRRPRLMRCRLRRRPRHPLGRSGRRSPPRWPNGPSQL